MNDREWLNQIEDRWIGPRFNEWSPKTEPYRTTPVRDLPSLPFEPLEGDYFWLIEFMKFCEYSFLENTMSAKEAATVMAKANASKDPFAELLAWISLRLVDRNLRTVCGARFTEPRQFKREEFSGITAAEVLCDPGSGLYWHYVVCDVGNYIVSGSAPRLREYDGEGVLGKVETTVEQFMCRFFIENELQLLRVIKPEVGLKCVFQKAYIDAFNLNQSRLRGT